LWAIDARHLSLRRRRVMMSGVSRSLSPGHVTRLLAADRVSTRKTETRHPHRLAAALSRSDGSEARTIPAAPSCPHLKPDSGCQRQRLSFIGRGVAPMLL
jgi:hypothetical protein